MLCLYTSDVHGNRWIYAKLFERAARPEVGALLLGGDLSPLTPPLDVMIERQGRFWSDFLWPQCEELRRAGKRVLLIPGNDDLRIHDELLRRGHERGVWELVDGTRTMLQGFAVVGCSYVSLTPFFLKDREAYDLEPWSAEHQDAIDLRNPDAIFSVEPEPERLDRTLLERLDALFSQTEPGRPTILMAHCPPHGTAIDVLYDGRRVGSRAVRSVIERHRPVLGLHGHIHESPAMPGGSSIDRLGDTIVVNPGSSHHDGEKARLHLVSFDTADISGTVSVEHV